MYVSTFRNLMKFSSLFSRMNETQGIVNGSRHVTMEKDRTLQDEIRYIRNINQHFLIMQNCKWFKECVRTQRNFTCTSFNTNKQNSSCILWRIKLNYIKVGSCISFKNISKWEEIVFVVFYVFLQLLFVLAQSFNFFTVIFCKVLLIKGQKRK